MTIKLDLDPEAVRDAVSVAADSMVINQIVDQVVVHKNGGATVTFATHEQVLEYVADLDDYKPDASDMSGSAEVND